MYDYEVKDDKLAYFYWDTSGSQEVTTDFAVSSFSSADVSLKQNQIWYKEKQITDDVYRKKKPMLVNGTTLVYLSDENRGVSFYTLRKIHLSSLLNTESEVH